MNSIIQIKRLHFIFCMLIAGLAWDGCSVLAAPAPISGILATYDNLTYTNDDYSAIGGGSGDFPAATTFDMSFNVGSQNNLYLTGFEVGGTTFNFILLADIINIERVDNSVCTGAHHIVLYEESLIAGTTVDLMPGYAPTMEESLRSPIVNRGADNVFANQGDGNGNNNNIQRIDYIFPDGFPVFNYIDQRGFLVMDRGGNDRFKIAAITALDGSGLPSAFTDPVSVLDTDWGDSGITINTTVMRGYTEGGDPQHPSANVGDQPLSGVFINWQTLGLQTNDFIYGYSLAGNDATTDGTYWTEVANTAYFPTNTSPDASFGGLDLISGGMMFFDENLDVTIGDFVWDDWDGDGFQDVIEPGLPNVLVYVYDSNTNLAGVARTDDNGFWQVLGIGPGTFFTKYFLPTNYQFTVQNAGTNTALDSNADINTGESGLITIGSGGSNNTVDAGMHLAPGDLRLTKSVLPTDVKKGDLVVYTLSITNVGIEDVSLTQVTDVLPPAVAFASYGATTGTYSDATGIWDIGDLAVGAAGTLTITGTVNSGYGGATITNIADITRMNRPDTNLTDNSDSATFTIQHTDLAVLKSVLPTSAEEGDPVDFTILLTNNGPNDATGIELTDLLPAGLSYDGSVPSQGSYASGTGIWTVGGLTNGGSASLVITATTLAGSGGTTLTNTVDITASSHDDLLTNNTASAELSVLGADLGIGKRVNPATASEGQTVVYTVSLTNFGPAAVTGVTASEPLMAGVTYVSNTVSQGSYNSGLGVWTVGALAHDAVATLEIWATVDAATAGTVLTNTSAITASSLPDPNPANDTNSATVAVSTLRLDKTSDVSVSVEPGGTITYTMIVTNYGATTHTNVTLTDAVPAGTTYVPGSVAVTRFPEAPPVPTTVVYDASTTFTAPAGVTSVTVMAWGGGGGGGRETGRRSTGGGGAGGAFAMISNYAVTPGSNYAVTVGAGGAGGSVADRNGQPGGASWFGTTGTVSAEGGAGGEGMASNNGNGVGGTGSAAASVGDVTYRGGNGAQGNTGASGAGGGGAGSTGPGGDASVGTGGTGTSLYGGDGADGVGNDSDGAPGSPFGGGGSGGNASNNDDHDGGDGAQGRITVYYELASQTPGTSGDPPDLATGWELDPGQWLEVTFEVVVDDPLSLMAITNTASVTSEIQTISLTDTVIDPLIPVDLGAGKTADADWVSETDAVKFTISVTNLSTLITATGVELSDLLPAGFNYVSNTASQGSYVSGTGIWSVGSLSPLATATLDIYSTAAVGAGGFVWTNTVDITALDQTDINPANDTASVLVGVNGADLAVIKTVDNSTPNEGAALIYSIVITNQGPSDTTGVTVSEPLTNGLTYVSNAVSQGSYNSGLGIWTVGDLDVGDSATLWVAVTVDAGTKGTSITNWSRITASDMPDPVATNDQDSAVIYVSGLIVTKVSDVAGYAIPGSNIVYTMVVSNSGAVTHTGLDVTDVLPVGTTYVPGSLEVTGPNWTTTNTRDEFNAQAYTNNDGTMDWNADWQENDPAGAAGPVGNYVGVTTGGGQLFMHWAYVGDEWASRAADLSGYASAVLRYDWETVNLNGSQTVSVMVSTNGAAPYVTVATYNGTDSGSEEIDITSFMSTNTTVRFENLSVNWDNGDYGYLDNVEMEALTLTTNTVYGGGPPTLTTNRTLGPGEVLTLTFEVTVDNPCGVTQIVNTVSVTSDLTPVPVTATVSDPVAYTDLALTKTVDDPHPAEGDSVTYTITVTNKGPVTATGLQVTEPLTNGLTYVSDVPSQGTYDDATGLWDIGTLAVGGTVNLTITADVDPGTAGTSITNLSRISAMDQADPTPGDNRDTAVITVEAVDVGVGKSVYPAVPVEKEQLIYTVSVTNFGPDTATGVVVTDLLPSGLTYVSDVASQGSYNDGTGLWTVGTLAMLQVETLSITAIVDTNTAGTSITNTATRTATDQVDTNALNDTASVVVVPTQAPLDIFKSVNPPGPVDPGDTLTYTIVVTNISAQTQTGVEVTDTLPTNVTYVADSISVMAPVTTNATVLDRFSSRSYGNNDGSTNWSANWVESEGDDPLAGNVQILFDAVRISTFTLRFAGPGQTMSREANLSGKSGATLSFDYRRDGLEAGEYVAVEVSSNGTAGTFTEVGRFNGAATDGVYANFSYDIGAWISTSTVVRFLSPAGMDATDILWIDDVQIETERRVQASVPGSAPPDLVSGLTLEPGEVATLTFDVTVNTPCTATQVVNSASVVSDQMTQPRSSTVAVSIRTVDLAIEKFVSDDTPSTNQVIAWTLVITNIGPVETDGVEVTDVLPAKTAYISYGASQGVYSNSAHVWYVGYMDVGDVQTLTITAQVQAVSTDVFTNRAEITASDVFDIEPTNDWAEVVIYPTLVSITSFRLLRGDSGLVVEWVTGSENSTAGFHLERMDKSGSFVRVNEELLPALFGAPQGGIYQYPDRTGAASAYRIVEVEYNGTERIYGPFNAEVEPAGGQRVSVFRSNAHTKPLKVRTMSGVKSAVPGPFSRLKIPVRETGACFVSAADIAALTGRSEAEIVRMLGRAELKLGCDGEPVAYRAADNGMYFFAEARETIYSDENVYILEEGAGLRVETAPGKPVPAASGRSFMDTRVYEQSVYAETALFDDPEEDFWLWDGLVAGHATLGRKIFMFDAADPASSGTAVLSVRLKGLTDTPAAADHHARISVNGALAAEGQWNGQDDFVLTAVLDAADLLPQANALQIEAVKDASVTHSTFYLDNFELSWPRCYRAVQDQLILNADRNPVVTVEGFSSSGIDVWDVTQPKRPVRYRDLTPVAAGGAWSISFRPAAPNCAYAVFAQARQVQPAGMPAAALRDGAIRCAYLVITDPELAETAALLVDYRRTQGLPGRVVSTEDIYNEFSEGIRTPHAINAFLKYAAENWAQPPQYVLLAGAGSYDYRNFRGYGECLVPPLMVSTPRGLYASDNRLADLNGDKVPDISIGRLPAETPDELKRMISRIVSYEKGGDWKNGILMAADNADAGGRFPDDSDALALMIPSAYRIAKTYLGSLNITVARNQLVGELNAGQGILHYIGHASLTQLAAEGLFRTAEQSRLTNDTRAAFAMIMSCTAGRFDIPGYDGLTETLLKASAGGASAAWAPAVLAHNDQNVILSRSLLDGLLDKGDERIGDAVLRALGVYSASRRMDYMLDTFTLLGDPATAFSGRSAEASFEEWAWWHFGVDGVQNPLQSGALADPDGDGNANLMEFALNIDPKSMDGAVAVWIPSPSELNGKHPVFSYDRRKAPAGTHYRLEVAGDLPASQWLSGPDAVQELTVQSLDETMERVAVWVNESLISGNAVFVRLRVIMD